MVAQITLPALIAELGIGTGAGLASAALHDYLKKVKLTKLEAIKLSAEFDRAFRRINARTGELRTRTDKWRKSVLELAPAVGKGPALLARELDVIAGKVKKTVKPLEVLRASAVASILGFGSIKSVAGVVTSAMNTYGSATFKAANATNILMATVKAARTTTEALGPAMSSLFPVAEKLGLSMKKTGIAVATMARAGITTAPKAAKALEATFAAIDRPSEIAQREIKKLIDPKTKKEFSFDQLRLQIRNDGHVAAFKHLKDLIKNSPNNFDERKLFPNLQAYQDSLALTGEKAKLARKEVKELVDAGGLRKSLTILGRGKGTQVAQIKAEVQSRTIATENKDIKSAEKQVEDLKFLHKRISNLEKRIAKERKALSIQGLDGFTKAEINRGIRDKERNIRGLGVEFRALKETLKDSGVTAEEFEKIMNRLGVTLEKRSEALSNTTTAAANALNVNRRRVATLVPNTPDPFANAVDVSPVAAINLARVDSGRDGFDIVAQVQRNVPAINEQKTALDGLVQSMDKGINVTNLFDQAFTQLTQTGKINFKSLARSVLGDVQKMLTGSGGKGGIGGLLSGLLGGATKSSQGGGGFLSNIFGSVFQGLFAKGGVLEGKQQTFAQGGVVNKPTVFPMKVGFGLMGEAGPEGILPLRRGRGGRLGVEASGMGGNTGGGSKIQVNIINQAGVEVETKPVRKNEKGEPVLDVLLKKIDQAIGSGRFDKSMDTRFGTKPKVKLR